MGQNHQAHLAGNIVRNYSIWVFGNPELQPPNIRATERTSMCSVSLCHSLLACRVVFGFSGKRNNHHNNFLFSITECKSDVGSLYVCLTNLLTQHINPNYGVPQ